MSYLKTYEKPDYNIKEILRYMGCKEADEALSELVDECINELGNRLTFKVCYTVLPINFNENGVDLTFAQPKSTSLARTLCGCRQILLFAATVGLEIDRLIARYGIISPVKSVIYQAIGAERIESLCDAFEADVRKKAEENGKYIRPRFSPGYGDLELDLQTKIFDVLNCGKRIGLTLNDSLLMSPSKSVTAIIGISDEEGKSQTGGCAACGKKDCAYRRKL